MFIFNALLIFIIYLFIFFYLSKKFKIIDLPNDRKIHQVPVPLIGGLIIFFSFFTLLIYQGFQDLNLNLRYVLYGSLIILIIGFIDDFKSLNPKIRMICQFFVVSIVVYLGLFIRDIGDFILFLPLDFKLIGVFLTIFSVLCLINAVNFIDGSDGLSISLIIIMLLNIYINILNSADEIEKFIIEILLFFSIIFLFFNLGILKKFKIFLGDAGSTSFGFIIAFLLVYFTLPEKRYFEPVLAIWIVTLPMFDLLSVILKRLSKKIKIYYPDKNHIHHIFLQKGFSQLQTLIIISFLSIFLNLFGHFIYYNFGNEISILSFIFTFIIYFFILKKII